MSLDLTELQSVAEQFGVSDEQVHRDHVVSHLLALISGELADAILFIGGTAIDDTVAREYGRLAAAAVAAGRKPRARAMDLLIAATASAHDARLYTRNPSDLAGL